MRYLFFWFLALLILAACSSGGENRSIGVATPRDQSSISLSRTQAATLPRPTLPPEATFTPETIQITRPPTLTPYPTLNPDETTPEPLEDRVYPGAWMVETFTDANGTPHTLSEYLGRGVVLHLLTASCEPCMEQQRALVQAIEDRLAGDLLPDTVFLVLSTNPQDTPSLLQKALQDSLSSVERLVSVEDPQTGELQDTVQLWNGWEVVQQLAQDNLPADWIIGNASPALVAALEQDFRSTLGSPDVSTIIVIAPDGLAHLTPEGLVDVVTLRDAITFYGNTPAQTDG